MGEIADPHDPIRNCHITLIKAHSLPTFATATKLRCHRCDWTPDLDCDHCHGLGYQWISFPGGWRIYPVWSAPLENFFEFRSVVSAHDLSAVPDSFGNMYQRSSAPEPLSKPMTDLLAGLIPKSEPIKRRI